MIKNFAYLGFFLFFVFLVLYIFRYMKGYRERFMKRAEADIDILYLGIRPEQLWLLNVVSIIFGALLFFIATGFKPLGTLIGGILGFFVPQIFINRRKSLRLIKFNNQLVEAITLIANSLKAGLNLNQAVEMVTKELGPPISQEFGYALKENRLGTPMEIAMSNIADRIDSEDLEIVINAMSIALETGGVLSEVFTKIADTIRERNRVKGKLDALTSQGKMQGIIMTLLPWGLALILFVVSREMITPLFTHPVGLFLIGLVVILELLGWFFIRKIMKINI